MPILPQPLQPRERTRFTAMSVQHSVTAKSPIAIVILEEGKHSPLSETRASLKGGRPSLSLEHSSDGILDSIAATNGSRHRQTRAIRRPIGIVDVLQNLARRSTG